MAGSDFFKIWIFEIQVSRYVLKTGLDFLNLTLIIILLILENNVKNKSFPTVYAFFGEKSKLTPSYKNIFSY
jgi:hypothetical protein